MPVNYIGYRQIDLLVDRSNRPVRLINYARLLIGQIGPAGLLAQRTQYLDYSPGHTWSLKKPSEHNKNESAFSGVVGSA